jgi:hypothetical protein
MSQSPESVRVAAASTGDIFPSVIPVREMKMDDEFPSIEFGAVTAIGIGLLMLLALVMVLM